MKILIFAVLLIVIFYLIPENSIGEFVTNYVPIHGDGEKGMNHFDSAIIIIKVTVSAVVSLLLLWLYKKIRS
jgi:hypothetical protein